MAALIKLGSLVTVISGKIGGQSIGHGATGTYIKNIGSYTNNRSRKRQASKVSMTTISERWRLLTDNDRAQWRDAATQRPQTNRIGVLRNLSGYNLFVQYQMNLNYANREATNSPGNLFSFNQYDVAITESSTSLLQVTIPEMQEDCTYIIFTTPTMSAGRLFSQKQSILVGVQSIDVNPEPINFTNVFVDRYGTPLAGSRIYCFAKVVNSITGQSPESFPVATAIITI